jgi:hypothetical protein
MSASDLPCHYKFVGSEFKSATNLVKGLSQGLQPTDHLRPVDWFSVARLDD